MSSASVNLGPTMAQPQSSNSQGANYQVPAGSQPTNGTTGFVSSTGSYNPSGSPRPAFSGAQPISADNLTSPVTPLTVPPPTTGSPSIGHAVTAPQGTTTDASGNAVIPPPAKTDTQPDPQTSTQNWIRTQLAALGGTLGGKGAATVQAQNDAGLAQKTADATSSYNAYNQAKVALQQQIENLRSTNPDGQLAPDKEKVIADVEARGNANLANLAVQAQASQGLLSAAEKTIQDKITAQFQPITDQIDFLTKFNSVNNNDLTDSQKEELTLKTNQLKTDSAAVQTAASDIHQALLKNNAPVAAYSAIDKVTSDYAAGRLTSAQAQSQMYAAAGRYTASAQNTSYVPGANPVVDSHIANVLNGNETMAQVPANLRNAVSVGMNSQPAAAYSPIAASRFTTAASRITAPYTAMSAYKLTADGQVYLDRIDAAMKSPGSVSDQDLLDSLTKLNTGGNAISDAQVKIITDGKSLSDIANTFSNKLKTGGVLSNDQRQQIQSIAQGIFANYKKTYQPIYDKAAAQLTAAGVPKAFWTIPDLNNLSAQTGLGGDTGGGSQQTVKSNGQDYVVGQQYTDKSGATWTVDSGGKWAKK